MQNTSTKLLSPLSPNLLKGQVWQFGTRFITIVRVGRHLVEHRAMTPFRKRFITPVSISAIREVQQFLTANKAVLVENS